MVGVIGKTTLANSLDDHGELAVMPYRDILPKLLEKPSWLIISFLSNLYRKGYPTSCRLGLL